VTEQADIFINVLPAAEAAWEPPRLRRRGKVPIHAPMLAGSGHSAAW
jgi:hypothetical protein